MNDIMQPNITDAESLMSWIKNVHMKDLWDVLVNEDELLWLNKYVASFFLQLKNDVLRRVVGKPHLYKYFLKWYENLKELSENIHQNILPNVDVMKKELLTNISADEHLPATEKEELEQQVILLASDLEENLIPVPYRLKSMEDIVSKMKKKVFKEDWSVLLLDFSIFREGEEGEKLAKFNFLYKQIVSAINSYYTFVKMIEHIAKTIKH